MADKKKMDLREAYFKYKDREVFQRQLMKWALAVKQMFIKIF